MVGIDIEDVDEDIAEDQEGMPEEVTGDLETMVSESDEEDDLPLMNLSKKRKFNNVQWKREYGSFNFSIKLASTN